MKTDALPPPCYLCLRQPVGRGLMCDTCRAYLRQVTHAGGASYATRLVRLALRYGLARRRGGRLAHA